MRYIGVDTPETVKPGTPVQCFAQARRAPSTSGCVAARAVRLVFDAERRDRYGRLLAYVYREPDGLFVNAELVRGGYARAADDPAERRARGRVPAPGRDARAAGPWAVVVLPGVIDLRPPMRMRQSLADIEAAFVEEIDADRERRERIQAQAIAAQPASATASVRRSTARCASGSCCSRSSRPRSS